MGGSQVAGRSLAAITGRAQCGGTQPVRRRRSSSRKARASTPCRLFSLCPVAPDRRAQGLGLRRQAGDITADFVRDVVRQRSFRFHSDPALRIRPSLVPMDSEEVGGFRHHGTATGFLVAVSLCSGVDLWGPRSCQANQNGLSARHCLLHSIGSSWDTMKVVWDSHRQRPAIMPRTRGLTLQEADCPELERQARSQTLPLRQVQRARLLLTLAAGQSLAAARAGLRQGTACVPRSTRTAGSQRRQHHPWVARCCHYHRREGMIF